MRQLEIAPRALQDLEDIAAFSSEAFGHRQTDRYLKDFDDLFERLLEFPQLGKPLGFVMPDFHRIQCGQHYVYYTFDDAFLHIVRVLHTRQLQYKALFNEKD